MKASDVIWSRWDALWHRGTRLVVGDDYGRADARCRFPPEWLVLVINSSCNLRCKMCDVGQGASGSVYYAHLVGTAPRTMPLDLLQQILAQAGHFFPRPRIGLAFTEPLLHPHILEFCQAVVEHGFYCSITTNGFLLPGLADALVDIGVHEITVSADGPEDVHDQLRGRKGSFQNLCQGVERLGTAKVKAGRARPNVRFSYTITDENYTRMLDFAHQISGLHPTSVNFSHPNFISREMVEAHNSLYAGELSVACANVGSMNLEGIDVEGLWQALLALKSRASSQPEFPPLTYVPDFRSREGLQVYYRQPQVFVGGRNCTDPWRLLMVKTDGTVNPAHARCYNFPIGNITVTPLPELWNHARLRTFRRILNEAGGALPACTRCCGVIGKQGRTNDTRDSVPVRA